MDKEQESGGDLNSYLASEIKSMVEKVVNWQEPSLWLVHHLPFFSNEDDRFMADLPSGMRAVPIQSMHKIMESVMKDYGFFKKPRQKENERDLFLIGEGKVSVWEEESSIHAGLRLVGVMQKGNISLLLRNSA